MKRWLILLVAVMILGGCSFKEKDKNQVPLPNEESVVWNFLNLIKEGRSNEAVNMLEDSEELDNDTRQVWAVQFNNWAIDKITKVEAEGELYRVEWIGKNGGDTKWIDVVKNDDGMWRIKEIATGP